MKKKKLGFSAMSKIYDVLKGFAILQGTKPKDAHKLALAQIKKMTIREMIELSEKLEK